MKKLKRWIAVVLACLLCVGLFPASVSAIERGSCGDNLTWTFSDGTLTIAGSGKMTSFTDSRMPPWYGFADRITRVVIKNGVETIGSLAFFECRNLKSVTVPESVTMIHARAFKNCVSLPYIAFPSGLKLIGEAAFENCKKLTGIRLPNSLLTIENYAFYRCSSLTSITIPDSVIRFGMVVFSYCESLAQATINCPIIKLPDSTFYGCKNLSTVVLPDTVARVGEYTFYDCVSLDAIHYSGEHAETIVNKVKEDVTSVSSTVMVVEHEFDGTATFSGTIETVGVSGNSGYVSHITTVKETSNATITQSTESSYTFTQGDKTLTLEEAIKAAEENQEIEVETIKEVTIIATVDNSDGWTEVAQTVKQAQKGEDPVEKVTVTVNIPSTEITYEDLSKFENEKVILSTTTNTGETWKIDTSSVSDLLATADKENLSGEKDPEKQPVLNLTTEVSEVVDPKVIAGIESETAYAVKFEASSQINATIAVNVGNPYQLATLCQKERKDYAELQTVVVDADGNAWFSVANVDSETEYFVGINKEGVTRENAIIPETLYKEYGITSSQAFMDSNGVQYVLTGRSSRWGISLGQFSVYVAIVIGVMIAVVTGIMLTLNKLKKIKMSYVLADGEDDPIDEEALRLEIMKEMLAETQNKNQKK